MSWYSDYVYALQKCYATGIPYIAAFEDDIIIADGWMAKTSKALRNIEKKAASGKWKDWIYLRLFYTETSLFWRAEDDFWYRNMWLTFLLSSFTGFVLLVGIRYFAPGSRKHLDNYVVATICLLTIPAFTALAFMVGKNLLVYSHRGVFELEHHGCCTQGLVFPREQIPDLIKFLEDLKSGQTDMMIEEYADTNGKPKLALEPQVVQHVGLVSSRDNNEVNSRSTWAFWFEGYDPDKLKKEHMRLLEAY
jgi:GR25 family glycosyltransferase involved in LPS biosynthesis